MKKAWALFVVLVYGTTQIGFASKLEADFWAARRERLPSSNRRRPAPQYASLPSNLAASASDLSAQLPSVKAALPRSIAWSGSDGRLSPRMPAALRDLAEAVPAAFGTVPEINEAGNKNPPVVLIQDVHLNAEAQTNIAAVLQELIDQKKISAVGVEASFAPLDFSPLRAFTDKTTLKQSAQAFVDHNEMAAPSFVGITSASEPPPFIGVDDRLHYRANVDAYLESRKAKDALLADLRSVNLQLAAAKRRLFPDRLRAFDDLRSAFRRGDVGFGAYLKKLSLYGGDVDPMIEQFLAAYAMESSLDFNRVDRERRGVIEALTKVLKRDEIDGLIGQSLAYRAGRIGFGAYYRGLKALCERHAISLRKTPAFDDYIRYVLLSDGIRPSVLFERVAAKEKAVVGALAETPPQKELAALSEHVSLVERLADFSLTPAEWDVYSAHRRTIPDIASVVAALAGERAPAIGRANELDAFESFYREAEVRSESMVKGLLAAPAGARVLVCGGFHTPQISKLLRERKISTIVVSPKISKVDSSGSSYLSAFAQEKTPLDKLFQGEKLFLGVEGTNVADDNSLPLRVAMKTGLLDLQNGNPPRPGTRLRQRPGRRVLEVAGHSNFIGAMELQPRAVKLAELPEGGFVEEELSPSGVRSAYQKAVDGFVHVLAMPIIETLALSLIVSFLRDHFADGLQAAGGLNPAGVSAVFFIVTVFIFVVAHPVLKIIFVGIEALFRSGSAAEPFSLNGLWTEMKRVAVERKLRDEFSVSTLGWRAIGGLAAAGPLAFIGGSTGFSIAIGVHSGWNGFRWGEVGFFKDRPYLSTAPEPRARRGTRYDLFQELTTLKGQLPPANDTRLLIVRMFSSPAPISAEARAAEARFARLIKIIWAVIRQEPAVNEGGDEPVIFARENGSIFPNRFDDIVRFLRVAREHPEQVYRLIPRDPANFRADARDLLRRYASAPDGGVLSEFREALRPPPFSDNSYRRAEAQIIYAYLRGRSLADLPSWQDSYNAGLLESLSEDFLFARPTRDGLNEVVPEEFRALPAYANAIEFLLSYAGAHTVDVAAEIAALNTGRRSEPQIHAARRLGQYLRRPADINLQRQAASALLERLFNPGYADVRRAVLEELATLPPSGGVEGREWADWVRTVPPLFSNETSTPAPIAEDSIAALIRLHAMLRRDTNEPRSPMLGFLWLAVADRATAAVVALPVRLQLLQYIGGTFFGASFVPPDDAARRVRDMLLHTLPLETNLDCRNATWAALRNSRGQMDDFEQNIWSSYGSRPDDRQAAVSALGSMANLTGDRRILARAVIVNHLLDADAGVRAAAESVITRDFERAPTPEVQAAIAVALRDFFITREPSDAQLERRIGYLLMRALPVARTHEERVALEQARAAFRVYHHGVDPVERQWVSATMVVPWLYNAMAYGQPLQWVQNLGERLTQAVSSGANDREDQILFLRILIDHVLPEEGQAAGDVQLAALGALRAFAETQVGKPFALSPEPEAQSAYVVGVMRQRFPETRDVADRVEAELTNSAVAGLNPEGGLPRIGAISTLEALLDAKPTEEAERRIGVAIARTALRYRETGRPASTTLRRALFLAADHVYSRGDQLTLQYVWADLFRRLIRNGTMRSGGYESGVDMTYLVADVINFRRRPDAGSVGPELAELAALAVLDEFENASDAEAGRRILELLSRPVKNERLAGVPETDRLFVTPSLSNSDAGSFIEQRLLALQENSNDPDVRREIRSTIESMVSSHPSWEHAARAALQVGSTGLETAADNVVRETPTRSPGRVEATTPGFEDSTLDALLQRGSDDLRQAYSLLLPSGALRTPWILLLAIVDGTWSGEAPTYYDILGVRPSDDNNVLDSEYAIIDMLFSRPGNPLLLRARERVRAAYTTLRDPHARQRYNTTHGFNALGYAAQSATRLILRRFVGPLLASQISIGVGAAVGVLVAPRLETQALSWVLDVARNYGVLSSSSSVLVIGMILLSIGLVFAVVHLALHPNLWSGAVSARSSPAWERAFWFALWAVGGMLFAGLLLLPGGFELSQTSHLVLNAILAGVALRQIQNPVLASDSRLVAGLVKEISLGNDADLVLNNLPSGSLGTGNLIFKSNEARPSGLTAASASPTIARSITDDRFADYVAREVRKLGPLGWSAEKQVTLMTALRSLGIRSQAAAAINSGIEATMPRVEVMDAEVSADAFIDALVRAGAARTSVTVVAANETYDYFAALTERVGQRYSGLRLNVSVKPASSGLVTGSSGNQFIDPAILASDAGVRLEDMVLIRPERLALRIDPNGPLAAILFALQNRSILFEQLVPRAQDLAVRDLGARIEQVLVAA